MLNLEWRRIDLVVFDVDGTLYDQRLLRRKMIRQLLNHCLVRPWDWRVLQVIAAFRRERERLAESEVAGIRALQYRRPAEILGLEPEKVRRIVEEWMLQRPLLHLHACRYAKVADFVDDLARRGVATAVLSDYPSAEKLRALGLEIEHQVSATDPEVDRLKPHPRGLQRVLELTGIRSDRAVLVGDRDDRDGECARRAGVSYLIRSSEAATNGHEFRHYLDLVRSLHSERAEDAALQ